MKVDRSCGGFTLLEVLIALGILAIGISSAFALFAGATAAHKRAVDRIHASAIAEHAMADVESALAREVAPEALVENPPFEAIDRNWPGYFVRLNIVGLAVPDSVDPSADELLIEVFVGWKVGGVVKERVFRQIVVREALIK